MVEITNLNFESQLNDILEAIQKSDFVGLDAEFTGLNTPDNDSKSLFDDGSERYRKLRKSAQSFTLSQIGLSAFVKHPHNNCYEAHTYNFYLFPRPFGGLERHFLCQASSLSFLQRHQFDFNKFVYHGVSHLNDEQEIQMKRLIKSHDPFLGSKRDVDEDALQSVCSAVAQWLATAADGDKMELQDPGDIHTYILHSELRTRFSQVWTEEVNANIVVVKVTTDKRRSLETEQNHTQEERVMTEMLGFTIVFRALVQSKKLILGHNSLSDLVLMYQNFHRPLPPRYEDFKAEIHRAFPRVIDTKHVAFRLRGFLEDLGLGRCRGLSDLYVSLNSDKVRNISLFSPDIVHADGFHLYKNTSRVHEAGYDAFMCGCVFLRLAHLWSTRDINSMEIRPQTLQGYCDALSEQMNRINVIRAAVNHIRLDGSDPESRRPQWLFVKVIGRSHSLNSSELANLFSSYGTVDIKVKDTRQALVAVDTHRCGREILKAFYRHKWISVRKYSMWRHSPLIRTLLWTGVTCCGLVVVWSLYSSLEVSDS